MTTSIKPPEDPLGSGSISSTRSPAVNPARKAPSYSQLPEPTPVPNPPSTVGAAESTEQLPESHAVNAAPVIPPASTHKFPTPPTSVRVPSSIAGTTVAAEASILSSQPANAVPSISATTDSAGAAKSSTTAPTLNPTPHTASASAPSLAPKKDDQSPKQSDIGTSTASTRETYLTETSTAAPITATHPASEERESTRDSSQTLTPQEVVELYLIGVQDMYPELTIGSSLRSNMVLDEDWPNHRVNAADNAFRAVKDMIQAKELSLGSSDDDDKDYDSDGNSVSSVASYMQKKPKKTNLDDDDRIFFNSLPTCYALCFAFDTRDVTKSYCPFGKFNKCWQEKNSLQTILDGIECKSKPFTADGLRDHISQCHSTSWCGMGVKLYLHELYPNPKTAPKEVTSKQNKTKKKTSKLTHSQPTPPID